MALESEAYMSMSKHTIGKKVNSKKISKRGAKKVKEAVDITDMPQGNFKIEQALKEKADALKRELVSKEKSYQCVEINEDAKLWMQEYTKILARLQEQLQAIDQELELNKFSFREQDRDKRIQLLEKHNTLISDAILKLSPIASQLDLIENNLFPSQPSFKDYQQNKTTLNELFTSLLLRADGIEQKQKNLDEGLKGLLKADLELLQQQLQEIKLLKKNVDQMYQKQSQQMAFIPKELFTEVANQCYILDKKKFNFDQVCKLIEDKIEIAKQDAVIQQKVEELKGLHERLVNVNYTLYMASTRAMSERGDLIQDILKTELNTDERSRLVSLFKFNPEDYEIRLPLSSMKWDDDIASRQEMKNERSNLIARLEEKRKYLEHIQSKITAHQQEMKGVIGEDLEYCLKRARLYDALKQTNSARLRGDSFRHFERLQSTMAYDFAKGLNQPEMPVRLQDLLSYGFQSKSPDDSYVIREVRETSKELKILQDEFYQTFPTLDVRDNSFIYNGKSYPSDSEVGEHVKNYVLAKAKIDEVFRNGEQKVSYAEYIDFSQELQLLHESKTKIVQYLEAIEKEQAKNKINLLDIKSQLNKSYAPIILEEGKFKYKGLSYALNDPTHQLVKEYNELYQELSEALNKEFPTDSKSFRATTEKFSSLKTKQKDIFAFIEAQKQMKEELLEIQGNFLSQPQLTLQGKILNYKERSYGLDESTSKAVEEYNRLYLELTRSFDKELSPESISSKGINSQVFQQLKVRFSQLEEQKKVVMDFVAIQTQKEEFIERLDKFAILQVVDTNKLSYKGKIYQVNEKIKKQVDEYNRIYTTLSESFGPNFDKNKIKEVELLFEQLERAEGPFSRIQEFDKLTLHLQEQNDLINNKLQKVEKIQQEIDERIIELFPDEAKKLYFKDPVQDVPISEEDDPMLATLKSLKIIFRNHREAIIRLKSEIEDTQAALSFDNLDTSKEKLNAYHHRMKEGADTLVNDLKDTFTEHLLRFSSNDTLMQVINWIQKEIIVPLYNVIGKKQEETSYKPGFFAPKVEKNLHDFREKILPDLTELQTSIKNAAPAA